MSSLLQVRVTGILVEEGRLLLVKQKVSDSRAWSLPGGRVEQGETLEQAIIRELEEETGLTTRIIKLLYLCDKPDASLVHITFLLERAGGQLRMPTNEFDHNPISDLAFIPVSELTEHGFSALFQQLAQHGFPDAGSYKGLKTNIGL
ncbi:NUDIX hydrolase [Paenibacillus glycanilyticus]|uniref:NUDIX hydrolase n=1 Tax=Paenibacillus glycanilyticus TaxID=126569 RepID=UPI000FD73509|nr:NUDIX hydrolase [Paenibacillus glycanilyticus]